MNTLIGAGFVAFLLFMWDKYPHIIKWLIKNPNYFVIIAIVGTAVFMGIYYLLKNLWKNKTSITHGSAKWMPKKEKRELLNPYNKGLVIDGINRITPKNSYEHTMVVAPTGGGKTTTYIIPNIMNLDNASAVIIDPSGEIYKKTATGMKECGFEIKVINPDKPETTSRYNIFQGIKELADCTAVAETLLDHIKSTSTPIWHEAGSSYLATFLYYLLLKSKNEKKSYLNLASLTEILSIDNAVLELIIESYASPNNKLQKLFSPYQNANDEAKGGVQLTAKTALRIFLEDKIETISTGHNISFDDLRGKPTLLYIQIDETDIKHYSPFIKIFYYQLFKYLSKSETGLPLYIFLEEFGNIGKIPRFEETITTIRKRNVSISIILQDISQVKALYGEDGLETIINGGINNQLYFPGLGLKVCENLSNMLGNYTEHIQSSSKGQSSNTSGSSLSDSTTASNVGRKLLNPDEIRQLKSKEMIYIRGNLKPIKCQTSPYYEQKPWKPFFKACEKASDPTIGKSSVDHTIDKDMATEEGVGLSVDKLCRQYESKVIGLNGDISLVRSFKQGLNRLTAKTLHETQDSLLDEWVKKIVDMRGGGSGPEDDGNRFDDEDGNSILEKM